MMTELLYTGQTSNGPMSAIANIIEVKETSQGFALILNQSPFYPEGGGQPADHGTIGNAQVTDVQWVEGLVYHYVDQLPSERENLNCVVDWNRRMDLTQQHNGQHILSAVLFRDFDAKTIGFHLSETYTTIDIDQKLELRDVEKIEKSVMEAISKNLKVEAIYPTDEELEALPLRKQPKVEDGIRVIVIEGLDHSPCGGTHPLSTSEVLGLKVTKYENYKGGTRLEFVCGQRYMDYIQKQFRILEQMTQRLSAPLDQLIEQLEKKEQQLSDLKLQNITLTEALLQSEVEKWLEKMEDDMELGSFTPLYIYQYEMRSLDHLKRLSQMFTEAQDQVGLLLLSKNEDQTQLVLARPKNQPTIDCKKLFAEAQGKFSLKGGGAPHSVQGSLSEPEQTDELIEYIESLLM